MVHHMKLIYYDLVNIFNNKEQKLYQWHCLKKFTDTLNHYYFLDSDETFIIQLGIYSLFCIWIFILVIVLKNRMKTTKKIIDGLNLLMMS